MEFELIIKKIKNTLTKVEENIFEKWYSESSTHQAYFERVRDNYQKNDKHKDVKQDWAAFAKKIKSPKRKLVYRKFAVVASVFVLVGLYLLTNENKLPVENSDDSVVITQETEVGSAKAILTLEDGSDVALGKDKNYTDNNLSSTGDKLVYGKKDALGSSLNKKIAYNYLTIPRGGQFFLQLSDSTKVWLNSDSKIKYPVAFIEGQKRVVELIYGEAYFDVSPSTDHKGAGFSVHSRMQNIEVLGTEFNIKAYSDEDAITTTLVEGKVAIDIANTKKFLTPNQQSIFNTTTTKHTIVSVDVSDYISWRKGLFSFKNKPLKEIAKVLSRWYDIEVVFENHELEGMLFNGVLSKKQELERILSIINQTNNIAYEIKENKVIFK